MYNVDVSGKQTCMRQNYALLSETNVVRRISNSSLLPYLLKCVNECKQIDQTTLQNKKLKKKIVIRTRKRLQSLTTLCAENIYKLK